MNEVRKPPYCTGRVNCGLCKDCVLSRISKDTEILADYDKTAVFHKNGRTVAIELIAGPKRRGTEIREIPMVWKKREEFETGKRFFKDFDRVFWYFFTALDIRFRRRKKEV